MKIITSKKMAQNMSSNNDREQLEAQVRGSGDSLGFYGQDLENYVQEALFMYDKENAQNHDNVNTDVILNQMISKMEADTGSSNMSNQKLNIGF